MTQEQFMRYVELALKNLGHNQASRYNIEDEIYRMMQQYSEAQITEKVKTISFKK
ncbi:MAG: hypothetical protein HDT50_04735 [Lactobacillus sp.]|nr:hypothetical protein [Lactobacillus sp.]